MSVNLYHDTLISRLSCYAQVLYYSADMTVFVAFSSILQIYSYIVDILADENSAYNH